jgi:DNA-binding NtrC family response regulator
MSNEKVLVVDDDASIVRAITFVAENEGYKAIPASDGDEALEKFRLEEPSMVFLDINLPKRDGLEVLELFKERNSAVPIIIITGEGTMQAAVNAMKLGAFDYLTKPLDLNYIKRIIRNSLRSEPVSESEHANIAFGDDKYQIVGDSTSIQEVYKIIGSIAVTSNYTSVLITGESGTGKELVARAIHQNSKSADQPFIPINCTALPETLMESELFGHEKGAFTGAVDRRLGKFEIAKHGTIFLDEIGDLSPNIQQKLLRVLQEREFERLGGNHTLPVHARFITATNRDLPKMIEEGEFREDLYFRLKVADIKLPPLRDRKDDLELLMMYFLDKYNRQVGKIIRGYAPEVVETLQKYPFPGNVRELENIVHRAVILTTRDVILNEALDLKSEAKQSDENLEFPIISTNFSQSREHILEMFEKQFVATILQQYMGNVSAAATASGMTRQNLHRLIAKHSINSEQYK